MEFKQGDEVQVISGGPVMTVARLEGEGLSEGEVWCLWFEGKKKTEAAFPGVTLKKFNRARPRAV